MSHSSHVLRLLLMSPSIICFTEHVLQTTLRQKQHCFFLLIILNSLKHNMQYFCFYLAAPPVGFIDAYLMSGFRLSGKFSSFISSTKLSFLSSFYSLFSLKLLARENFPFLLLEEVSVVLGDTCLSVYSWKSCKDSSSVCSVVTVSSSLSRLLPNDL